MSSNFFFSNKSEQNLGNIDFTKIKSGLKKEDIQSSNQLVKSLFDLLDKNGDEVLNRNEIISLQNLLDEIDKDDDNDITEKEAGIKPCSNVDSTTPSHKESMLKFSARSSKINRTKNGKILLYRFW